MNIRQEREIFDRQGISPEAVILKFHGVDGFDVYNTSIPFEWNGRNYIFGRMERRSEWARSWVRLFENTGKDNWTLVKDSMVWQLEDPFITFIDNEIILGGTHVRYKTGAVDTFYGYFYRGTDLADLYYFTTGPDRMKDIRLIQLEDRRIGVFSRPRSEEVQKKSGAQSQIGFTVIPDLDHLTSDVIGSAPFISGLFCDGEWGGCNQAYLLDSGKIGVIGHKSWEEKSPSGKSLLVYLNIAFVFDPLTHKAMDLHIIGTRRSYPAAPPKRPELSDCAFTSGIVMRDDGYADLYSGIGDTMEGRTVIPYPFKGHGSIVSIQC